MERNTGSTLARSWETTHMLTSKVGIISKVIKG